MLVEETLENIIVEVDEITEDITVIVSTNATIESKLTTKGDLLGFDTQPNRFPIGVDGQSLVVDSTQPFGFKWAATVGSGDMLKSIYDPTNVNGDAFNQDNMADGTTNKNFTATEKNKLASITEIFTTALKDAYDGAVSWISTNGTALINHLSRTDNPHNVTKSQVGLGNVPNTDFTSAVDLNTAKRSYPIGDENKLAGLQDNAIKETRANNTRQFWDGTQVQYDAILTKDPNTYYFIIP